MDIQQILKVAVRGGASDIILKVGALPKFRLNGNLVPLSDGRAVTKEMMAAWIQNLKPTNEDISLDVVKDIDFSYQTDWGYRFRINIFSQQRTLGMVLRVVHGHVKTLEELQLPQIIAQFSQKKRGLILVTGATGSGKTTTLASIVEKINITRPAHIITIEDPIEYTYKENRSTINQRELGVDTDSFASALRGAMRQNPDVILVGELRDKETIETALMAAETGHLVLSTLHTQNATDSLLRIISFFETNKHMHIKQVLSSTLCAVVSQRLIPRMDKRGMVPAIEILVNNEFVRNQILNGEFESLPDFIAKGSSTYGMQSFDQSLAVLFQRHIISKETALENATNRSDLELKLGGVVAS